MTDSGLNRLFSAFVNSPGNQSGLSFGQDGQRKNPEGPATGVLNAAAGFRILRDQSGATAIEYCLIATGIAFAIIATVQGIGPQLSTKFTSVNNSLK